MDVTCSVDAADQADFERVVKNCRRAGLRVTSALDTIGVVTGSIDEAKLDALAAVRGVTAVERERVVRLPDPGGGVL